MSGDGVNFACDCAETSTAGCCEEAIAERQREAWRYELWYGDHDDFDPDR